jgi:proteasome accessory factor B
MSFRARMQRIAFIHRRLKHKRDYPSARELAADYLEETGDGFSARTFKRDIEWLRDEQAPIEYDVREHGYYYADETFELPTVMLTEGDLLAVLVTERALSSYRNSPYYERLRSIFDRLTQLLPEKVTVHSEDLAQNVTVVTEPVTEIDGEVWQVVQSCLEQGRSVAVYYRKPGYASSAMRVIDPYHLVGEQTEISVRFDAAVASKIRERQWHPNQEIEDTADGGIILRFRTNQRQQTLFWVAQWGPNAEILEPADLREQAAAWMEDAARRYRQPY